MKSKGNSILCTNCGSNRFDTLFTANDFDTGKEQFDLEGCDNCRLVRTAPPLSDSDLSQYYHQEYYGTASKKFSGLIEYWTKLAYLHRAKKILKLTNDRKNKHQSSLSILDIGCGRAHLLRILAEKGCQCVGIERADFPPRNNKNLTIYNQDFLDIDFEGVKFDVVILWHVLEHLLEPDHIIKKISHLLKPNGVLLLAVPNFGSLQAKLFKKYWFHLDLPRHTYHFSNRTLSAILKKNDFSIKQLHTWSLDQSIYGFIQSFVNSCRWFPPNDFYRILKHQKQNRFSLGALVQILLVIAISPIAITEFLVSGLINTGSCIVLEAQPRSRSNEN